jgi:hypothetical protein
MENFVDKKQRKITKKFKENDSQLCQKAQTKLSDGDICEHFHQYRRMAASAEPKGPFLLMFGIYLLWLIISFYTGCPRTRGSNLQCVFLGDN